jgi:DtxR family transcriptional regulator, Mn-dependent transcriptional regulator
LVLRSEASRQLSNLRAGDRGVVAYVARDNADRADRLGALGVTPGAPVLMLQTFPSVVFLCDQTELAVEPAVASAILVDVEPDADLNPS